MTDPAEDILTQGRPLLPKAEVVAGLLDRAISVGWLSNGGPLHERLEAEIAPLFGAGTTRLVSSGTMAVMMALRLGGLPEGSEVITSPVSFAATVQAILWCGFRPIFADVDPVSLNLDPEAVRRAITPRTSAILPVHFLGRPCEVDALQDIAARHGLWLAYDAAHAFGVTLNGRPIAGWGDASAFSLHATKLMHTGEGGALVVNDPDLRGSMARMRNFGLAAGRMQGLGTNAKLSEAQAALGLAVLPLVAAEAETRRRLRGSLDAALSDIPGIAPHPSAPGASDSLQYYALRMAPELRRRLHLALAEGRILARDHFPLLCGPDTMLPDAPIVSARTVPAAPQAAPQVLCLPFHGGVTDRHVAAIADIARQTARQAS